MSIRKSRKLCPAPVSYTHLRDIEARIEELEKILKNAEVVVEDEVDLEKINIGCRVKILDMEYNEEMEYKIVGSTEANSLKGKISNESPVGKALIGAKDVYKRQFLYGGLCENGHAFYCLRAEGILPVPGAGEPV